MAEIDPNRKGLPEEVFPHVPIRQIVLSFPFPLRFWMAKNPGFQSNILTITIRAVSGLLRKKAKTVTKSFQAQTMIDMLLQMKPELVRDVASLKKLEVRNTFKTDIFEVKEP